MRRRGEARRGRLLLTGATAAALVALLAGCIGIPTDGPVADDEIAAQESESDFTLAPPRGPRAGATPEEIVQGFAAAGIGPQDGYQVAKQYLTADFAAEWAPTARVLVVQGRGTPAAIGADRFELSVTIDAEVDNVGRYTPSLTPTRTALEYDLVQQDGEWRISSAPDGTVVVAANFNAVFDSYPLYFFDPSFRFLVPDLRWFPRLPTTSSRIVRSLLDGPASWLGSGALVTAFPTGTEVVAPPGIDDGTAVIDLTAEVLATDAAAKRRMLQQLQQSLIALDTITSVELTVNDLPVAVPDVDIPSPDASPRVDGEPLVVTDSEVGLASGRGVTGIPGVSGPALDLQPTAISLGRTQGPDPIAAVRSSEGVWRVTGGETALLDERPGLVAPGIDPHGFLWSAQAASPQQLVTVDVDGTVVEVATGISSTATLVAFELSRDGTRVLLALSTPSGPLLQVAAVLRDDRLAPTGLGAPITLPATAPLLDVAWIDGTSVAALERDDDRARVRQLQVGGDMQPLGGLVDASAVIGGNGGAEGVRVLRSDGAVLQVTSGGGWRSTGIVASVLGTQQ